MTLNKLVGERGFEPPTPLVPNYESTNSKCFIWCRLGNSVPLFLSLSCTEVVPSPAHLFTAADSRSNPTLHQSSAAQPEFLPQSRTPAWGMCRAGRIQFP